MTAQHGRSKIEKQDLPLQITSMMDMFTIILVFLLKSFSAEGSILTNADNLVLPNSDSHKKPTEINLQLAVTEDMILIDNIPLIPTDDIRKIPADDPDPVVGALKDKLESCLEFEENMVRAGALNEMTRRVVIQVDKNVGFDVLFKVMNTCGKAGYETMNFAVMEREG
jgi:biopolymer transport protein ExbD